MLVNFIKKYWFKLLSLVLIVVVSFYVLMVGIQKSRNYEILKREEKSQTIYTIWHVETFEGGGKARIDFIKSVSRYIEKENNEVLFMIKSVSPEKLQDELTTSKPDIISFGFGVGKIVLPYLVHLENTFNVRDELISCGSFNKKFYALPFMVSGYAMFAHSAQSTEFHVGSTAYTSPEKIYNNLKLVPIENETQYEAYKDFVYSKNVKLLGTGRDLFRVNNLNNIGRTNAIITPIDTYTDLIQFMGVTNPTEVTKRFIELALSDTWQSTLVNYSLFGSKHNKLYHLGIYSNMEDAIMNCNIPNVFNEKF